MSLGIHTTEWLKKKLRESHQDEITFREQQLLTLNNTLVRVRAKLDQVYDDKIDGVIDEETYHRKREQYLSERSEIEEQIKRHTIADDKYVDFGCLVLDVANRASEIYQVRKSEEKRYLLNFIFSNLLLQDKIVKFRLKSIFGAVLKYQESKNVLPLKDLFINRELEFDYTLDDFKILYSNFNIPAPQTSNYTS